MTDFDYSDGQIQSAHAADGAQLVSKYKDSLYSTWEKQHAFVRPGMGPDGAKILEITVRFMGQDASEKDAKSEAKRFAVAITKAAATVFNKDNILSSVYRPDLHPSASLIFIRLMEEF